MTRKEEQEEEEEEEEEQEEEEESPVAWWSLATPGGTITDVALNGDPVNITA